MIVRPRESVQKYLVQQKSLRKGKAVDRHEVGRRGTTKKKT